VSDLHPAIAAVLDARKDIGASRRGSPAWREARRRYDDAIFKVPDLVWHEMDALLDRLDTEAPVFSEDD
jgi:hypothetical protein